MTRAGMIMLRHFFALLAGSADFSTSTDTPFIFAALQGLKPIVLINYSRYSRDMKIVVSVPMP